MYFYVFFFTIVILLILYYTTIYYESFTSLNNESERKNILLLGDSILENGFYVEKSIESILKNSIHNIFNYAYDGTKISDIYSQIQKIPYDLNSSSSFIFLSVGGNDIIERARTGSTSEDINPIFDEYKNMIYSLKAKMDQSKIILLTLYYPYNSDYHLYYDMIKDWNKSLEKFAVNENLQILKTYNLLGKPEDFIHSIEPSIQGGMKIAQSILNF